MELISIVLGYFLSYRRTLLIANQKEYKCVKYDLIATFTATLLLEFEVAIELMTE